MESRRSRGAIRDLGDFRVKRRRGFLLVVVLGFSAALVFLFISLAFQGQSLESSLRHETNEVDCHLAMLDTNARMGIALSADASNPPSPHVLGNVDLKSSFRMAPSGESGVAPSITWGPSASSVRYPLVNVGASYDNLFGSGSKNRDGQQPHDYLPSGDKFGKLPRVGYQDDLIQKNQDGYPVAPGHVLMTQERLGNFRAVTVFDQAFPYAAYAPAGSVQLDEVVAWSNPTFDETEGKLSSPGDPLQFASGLPVNVRARGALTIQKNFPAGHALSEQGPIKIAGGGIALTTPMGSDSYCQRLSNQITAAIAQISDGTLNKSKWIPGKFLSFDGVLALFKGKADSGMKILSVQQAMGFPFPPIPMLQEDVLITVLMIHHPWPADFSGTASDTEDVKALEALNDQLKGLQKQIDGDNAQIATLQKQIGELQTQMNDPNTSPDDKKSLQTKITALQGQVTSLTGQVSDLNSQMDGLKDQIKEKQKAIDTKSKEVWNGLPGAIPQTEWDDLNQNSGSSWSYIILGEALMKALFKALGGDLNALINTLVPPVRLVHLGSMDPEWLFDDDSTWPYPGQQGYRMKATVNVPPGKTLRLSGDYDASGQRIEIQGDLWIQRGATCYVDGNLFVATPPNWYDLADQESSPLNPDGTNNDAYKPVNVAQNSPDGSTNPLYPWGRVILEEGATLIVTGNLNVSGGNRDTGSIICCSTIGSTRAINTAILCQGTVNATHGVYSGMTLEDLTARLAAQESPGLSGFYNKFLTPFMHAVVPNLCKIWGPWNYRESCYFASHATTFVFMNFLAEFGLAEIPFPLPLPIDNLERKIFTWMSKAYSFELNFNLGENLSTQCSWWLLGRGVTPYFLKIPPSVVKDALSSINYGEIAADACLSVLKDFMNEVIPDLIKTIIQEVAIACVEAILKEVVPFNFPSEPSDGPAEKEEKKMEDELRAEIKKIIIGETKKQVVHAVASIIVEIKNKILEQVSTDSDVDYLCREVPGVLIYAGQDMNLGEAGNPEGALTALGFFYAEGNLNVSAKRIVGSLVSRRGNITATGLLYYYPYFTRASLYNPAKPRDYSVLPTDELRNAFQFTTPNPGSNTAIDLSVPTARITAVGVIK